VLHSWRATKVAPDVLELLYDNQFLLAIPCTKYGPRLRELRISNIVENKSRQRRDPFPLFSELVVSQAESFASQHASRTLKQLLESLSDFWTSCAQIRTQLSFLSIKYPLVLEPLPTTQKDNQGFKANASLLFQKPRAKAIVSFVFDQKLLARWPFKIRTLDCHVKVAYGGVDPELIHSAVMQRLSEASVEDNHACLLDACVEASSRYE